MKKTPPSLNVTRARAMRRDPTDAERAMWQLLRENFPEARFRRQVPLGPFIADFASHRAKLVVEVDGGQHSPEADARRTAAIEAEGYRVVRFWNNEVMGNAGGCARALYDALHSHPHPTAPSEQARKATYPSPIEGEGAFISALRNLATDPGARGLNDDAAVLEIGGETLVLTHDVLVEGVHVLPGQDAADIAWKLVAVNLSDLAAKGATPIGVLLGHMLGEDNARFIEGLREVLARYEVPLLGGDTVSANGPRSWSLTAIGRATHRPVPSRADARPGDDVFVTGALGGALQGFEALQRGTGDSSAYCRPLPRLGEGRALAPLVTAMMDISDGLLLDAWRMATASDVSFDIDSESVPVADPARRDECLRWGDDYELLFTAPPGVSLPVAAHHIGTVIPSGVSPLVLDGQPVTADAGLGYQHR